MDQIVTLNSVDKYNKLYGLPTLHPLVSVIDLRKATHSVNHLAMNYELYALFLKQTKSCEIRYGRGYYDYQEGTIVCFAPGQTAQVSMIEDEHQPEVDGLLFHPDLIHGTALGEAIRSYSFFDYSSNEALHLSTIERDIVLKCLNNIHSELLHAIDLHSQRLIVTHIQLLLNYCTRFYHRQFLTRTKINKDVIAQFERLLNQYLLSNIPQQKGLPTVNYFADQVALTPNYFGDLIKKETGKTAQQYIQDSIVDIAKHRLLSSSQPVSQIAYQLGYQYPQHFTRLFKSRVGYSPNEYRQLSSNSR